MRSAVAVSLLPPPSLALVALIETHFGLLLNEHPNQLSLLTALQRTKLLEGLPIDLCSDTRRNLCAFYDPETATLHLLKTDTTRRADLRKKDVRQMLFEASEGPVALKTIGGLSLVLRDPRLASSSPTKPLLHEFVQSCALDSLRTQIAEYNPTLLAKSAKVIESETLRDIRNFLRSPAIQKSSANLILAGMFIAGQLDSFRPESRRSDKFHEAFLSRLSQLQNVLQQADQHACSHALIPNLLRALTKIDDLGLLSGMDNVRIRAQEKMITDAHILLAEYKPDRHSYHLATYHRQTPAYEIPASPWLDLIRNESCDFSLQRLSFFYGLTSQKTIHFVQMLNDMEKVECLPRGMQKYLETAKDLFLTISSNGSLEYEIESEGGNTALHYTGQTDQHEVKISLLLNYASPRMRVTRLPLDIDNQDGKEFREILLSNGTNQAKWVSVNGNSPMFNVACKPFLPSNPRFNPRSQLNYLLQSACEAQMSCFTENCMTGGRQFIDLEQHGENDFSLTLRSNRRRNGIFVTEQSVLRFANGELKEMQKFEVRKQSQGSGEYLAQMEGPSVLSKETYPWIYNLIDALEQSLAARTNPSNLNLRLLKFS